jgi:hypothetical protein
MEIRLLPDGRGIQGGIRVVDIGTAEWGRLVKSIYGRERKNAYNYYQDKQ